MTKTASVSSSEKSSGLDPVANFIGGKWSVPKTAKTTPVYNPSTGEIIAQTPMCGEKEVDLAVKDAHRAFADWSETPPVERCRILFRYKMYLEEEFEPLARSICREHGKNIMEARGDLRRGIEVVEYACGIPELLKGEVLDKCGTGN